MHNSNNNSYRYCPLPQTLAEASDTLEERVQDYEARLRVLSEENDDIKADYSAEIKSMEAERSSMRDRIASLESALTSSETAINQQRADLQDELLKVSCRRRCGCYCCCLMLFSLSYCNVFVI